MTELEQKLRDIADEKDSKILPENIKKDVQIFDVIGTYEGSGGGTVEGIKQFATEEEMQADSTAKEGDLAVVYSSVISNITADSQFQTAKVPSTVVLPEAFTDGISVRFQAVDSSQMFDCFGQLDSSNFMMDCYTESGSIRIQYESSDGITYTRTDGGEETVDFGLVIQFSGTWNDAIGYFIQSSSNYFGGIFNYCINEYRLAPTQLTATSNDVYEKEFYGKNGVENGTLGTNPSNLFDDSVASIIYSTNEIYATMTPLKITNANKDTISDNIRFIPVNSQGEALLDVSELTDVQSLFADKIYLKDIPCEFGNVYYMSSMCNGCSSLITFPYINTTNSQHANYLCYNCTNLKNVPVMDFANTNTWSNAFSGCPNLSDESLNNILAICMSATKSATKTLKYIGLTSAQATKCTTLSNYSAFTAAGWTTGY